MTKIGYKMSESHKEKIRLAHKGKIPKNLAWLHKYITGKNRPDMTGEKHWLWKGDNVSYRNLHRWVIRWLGKANHCENNKIHISSRFHWANISHEYKRELSDWKQLCPSCNALDRKG